MSKCSHSDIRVYEELTYTGKLVSGVVIYDSSAPEHEEITEIYCSECDKHFDVATSEDQIETTYAVMLAALQTVVVGNTDYDDLVEICAAAIAKATQGGLNQ